MMEHQMILHALPERPHHEHPQVPPEKIRQLRCEAFDYLPGTVNATRRAASMTSQVPDLNGPPSIKKIPLRIFLEMLRFWPLLRGE